MTTSRRLIRRAIFVLSFTHAAWSAERNILQDASFEGLRHFRGLETWRLAGGDLEVRRDDDAPDGYLISMAAGAVIGQAVPVPQSMEFTYTCVVEARSKKGGELLIELVGEPLSLPRQAPVHRQKRDAQFAAAQVAASLAPIKLKRGRTFTRFTGVIEGRFQKRRPRAFSLRLRVTAGEVEIARVVLAEGSAEKTLPIQTSLRVANQKGNEDYVLVSWEQTGGTYAVDRYVPEFREKETGQWRPIPTADDPKAGATILTGLEGGKTYELRCLGHAKGQGPEQKAQPDAEVTVGSARKEISFGANPYPLADMFGDPTPDQPLWLIRNELGWLELCLYDQDQKRVKARDGTWGDVVLEVPGELRIVGANYTANRFYPPGEPVPVRPAGMARVAGDEREVYYIHIDNPKVMKRSRSYFSPLDVYFDAGSELDGGRLSWWFVRDGQAGPRTEASVRVLPPIEFAGDVPFYHWLAFSDALTGDLTRGPMPREPSEILTRRTRLFGKIGVCEDYSIKEGWPVAADWAAAQPGIKAFATSRSQLTGKILAGYYYRAKPHPREKLEELVGGAEALEQALWKDAQGRDVYQKHEDDPKYRGNWNYWCNEYLRRTDTNFYRSGLQLEREHCPEPGRKAIARRDIKFMTTWDNEMDLGDKVLDHCFCERCVATFAERMSIALAGLTPDKILKDHRPEWRRFRNWQMGEVLRMWNHLNKELDPRLKSCLMFSGKEHHENIDIADATKYVDEFLIEQTCSGHFYFDELAKFMTKATKPVTGFSMECTPNGRLLPQDIYLAVMTSAAMACRGFMHERIGQICGKRIALCARANKEIGALWPYFREGAVADEEVRLRVLPLTRDRVYVGDRSISTDLSGPRSRLRHLVHRKGKELLIDLFNFSRSQPVYVHVSLPGLGEPNYRVIEPVSRRALTHVVEGKPTGIWRASDLAEGFVWRVGKQDVSFVLVTPKKVREQGTQPASYWEQEWQRAAEPGREFPPVAAGNVRISWEDVESDGSHEVRVETPVQTVSLSLAEGGQVWRWEIGEEQRSPLHLDTARNMFGKYSRTFGMDRFVHWGWGKGQVGAYELLSRRVEDGDAVIVLRARLEHLTGRMRLAELRKTYRISSTRPVIRVAVEIRSHREAPLKFRYYAPSIPYLAKPENDKLPEGRREWVQVNGVDCGEGHLAGGIYAPLTGEGVVMRVPKAEGSRLYLGGGATPPVVEWMAPPQQLACEQAWRAQYDFVYLRKTSAEKMPADAAKLLNTGTPDM